MKVIEEREGMMMMIEKKSSANTTSSGLCLLGATWTHRALNSSVLLLLGPALAAYYNIRDAPCNNGGDKKILVSMLSK